MTKLPAGVVGGNGLSRFNLQ